MLPIALTCPTWWVARWTARMLASLAVVVACSFGATTLPLSPAATASVAAPTPAGYAPAPRALHPSGPEPGAHGARAASGFDRARPVDREMVQGGLSQADRAGVPVGEPGQAVAVPVDRQPGQAVAVPVDRQPGRAVAVPVDRQRVLVGLVPSAVGPRAPPAR